MRGCFNCLEDSSNYSAIVLQTNVAKNTNSIAGMGIESPMLYVSWQSCLLGYGDLVSCSQTIFSSFIFGREEKGSGERLV